MEPERCQRGSAPRAFAFVGLILGTVLSSTISTQAQVGPLLSIRPWFDKPMWAETYDDILFFDKGHTKGADESISTFYWDSAGRIKFWKDEVEPPFSLGYRILTLDNDTDGENGFLDGQWNDVALTASKQFGPLFDSDWNLGLIAGMGTANDGYWNNEDAIYGLGTIDLWTPLSDEASLHTGISFDGNRSLIQDIPLPFVTYQYRIEGELDLAIGIPDTLVKWFFADKWSLTAFYHFPADVLTRVDFEIVEDSGVYLFGSYTRAVRQFNIDDHKNRNYFGPDNRRLFFEIDRVTTGVRWATKWFDASLGIGYTLDSRYRTGWDMRDLDTVRDLSEEIYASVTLQGTFP